MAGRVRFASTGSGSLSAIELRIVKGSVKCPDFGNNKSEFDIPNGNKNQASGVQTWGGCPPWN